MSTIASEVAEDYKSSLSDLVNNSKPQITFLTILAEESKEHAGSVVDVIVEHAYRVDASKKLPCLYLVDSIIKNVKGDYIKLFQFKIHTLFPHIFEKVDEKVRRKMYELRQTWNDYFRKSTLYQLDVKVQALDPAWPVTAPTPSASPATSSTVTSKQPVSKVFVNPSFVKGRQTTEELELLKLKRDKMILEEKKQKILDYEAEQAKLKVRANAVEAKPAPEKKPSSTHAPPISRSELLKSYKVKKKSTAPDTSKPPPPVVKDKPVNRGSSIHIDPRKASSVISPLLRKTPPSNAPPVVSSKPPHASTVTTSSSTPPAVKESEPSNRDPRTIKLAVFSKIPKIAPSTDKLKEKNKGKGISNVKPPKEKPEELFKPDPVTKGPQHKIKMDLNTVDVTKSTASSRDPRMKSKERQAPSEPKKEHLKVCKEANVVKEDPKPVKSKEERMKEIKNELKKSEKKLSSSRREEKTSSPKKDDKSSSRSPRKSTSPKSSSRSREKRKSESKSRDSSTKRKEEQTVKPTTEKPTTATDSFKRIDKCSHQKRNWRHRPTPSPEAMEVEQNVVEKEAAEDSAMEDVDSDESDHYEGNKPKVSTFSDKRISSGDVDLRLMSNSSEKPPINDLLFGSKDVDLRLFGTSTPAPNAPSLPAAFQAPTASAGGFEDTDFRKSLPKPEEGSTKSGEDESKNSFKSAPDLNSWDKFREKNPEFKEYQRQRSNSSTSETPSLLSAEVTKNKAIIRRKIFDDDNAEKSDVTSDEMERQKLRLKQIAEQAEEQLQLGNITLTQYNNTLKNVVSLHYKQTNRSQSVEPEEDHSLPPPPIPFSGRGRGYHRGGGFRAGAPRDPTFTEWPKDLPMMQPMEYRMVQKESETRRIAIDGKPREIRTYGTTAILLMDNFEPRTVSFQPGTCNIVFDQGTFVMTMGTNDDYKPVTIDGETHRVKLGVPTQELYIDDRGYQCFFGGKPVSIHLAGRSRLISLRGKPPNVSVGKEKNTEYLLGKVLLSVEGETRKVFPIYLDAKPQSFQAEGVPLVLKFIDKFTAVKINTITFPVTFGGSPLLIRVRDGMKVFLKFSALPPHIVPGVATVKAMDQDSLMPNYYALKQKSVNIAPPPAPPQLPLFPAPPALPITSKSSSTPTVDVSVPPPKIVNDKAEGIIPGAYNTNEEEKTKTEAPPPPKAPIDVSSLLATLVKVGIIGQKGPKANEKPVEMAPPPPKKVRRPIHEEPMDENDEDWIEFTESDHPAKNRVFDVPKMDFLFKSKQLRKRSSTLVSAMYRGIQCTNCGLRFSTEQTEQYSEHLDWHFRQNKKELDKNKKIFNRKFYLTLGDWYQYEEIEDIEERVPSIFEETKTRQDSTEENEESVAVSADDAKLGVCPVCTDTFTQFFQHDTDEWHYRNAVHREELNYHPTCYSDLLKQREKREEEKKKAEEKVIEDKKKAEEKIIEDKKKAEEKIIEEKKKAEEKIIEDKKKAEQEKIEKEKRIEEEKIKEEKRKEEEKIEEKRKEEEKIEEEKKIEEEQLKEEMKKEQIAAEEKKLEKEKLNEKRIEEEKIAEKKEQMGEKTEDNIDIEKKEEKEKSELDELKEKGNMNVDDNRMLENDNKEEEEVRKSLSKIVVDDTQKDNLKSNEEEKTPNDEKEKRDNEKEVSEEQPDKDENMQIDETGREDTGKGVLEKSDATNGNKNSKEDEASDNTENNKDVNKEKDESVEKEICEPPKKKSKKKKEKKPVEMIDHTPIQIKTEPVDTEEVMETFCTEQFPTPGIWPSIKEEKDDIEETVPEERNEEASDPHNEEERMVIDTVGDNGTSHLMVASMDGNVVQSDAPDINPLSGTGPRIRISGALRMAVSKNNNNNDKSPELNGVADDEDVDAVTILDDDEVMEWDEFTPPPFSANTEAHPSFVGKEIIDQGIRRAGIEDSGLCSIM